MTMFHPAEGVERLLLCDPCRSGIYDNEDGGTWTATDHRGRFRFWGKDKRRFVVSYLQLQSTHGRRILIAKLIVHAARRKRDVPIVTPTAALYRLGRKLGKDGLQGLLLSRETFESRFLRVGLDKYGDAKSKGWHKTIDAMHKISPVFEDEVPTGLVVGTVFPENAGRLTYSELDGVIGAGVWPSGVAAVRVKL